MRIAALFFALLLNTAAWAQDVLPVPPLSGRVIDQTATLSAPQQAAIEARLAEFESQAGPQIVVLLVPATAPEDIASYAQRVADTWKIGRRDIGDGLLLVVAKNDRTVRIEVAKALEGAVPDLAARQVIDRAMAPAFKTGDYAGGLNAGLDQLMARIKGENLPLPTPRGGRPATGMGLEQMGIFLFIGVALIGSLLTRLFGRGLGSLLTAGAAGGLAWVFTASLLMAVGAGIAAVLLVGVFGVGTVLRGLMMMSGRGGGGGGGGFSSGGGGDFGGGGASGHW
jgi:uncharacterized protein